MKGEIHMIMVSSVGERLSNLIERYGRIPFLLIWFTILAVILAMAYFLAIKPLTDEIVLYQSTIDKVELLQRKFAPLLNNKPHNTVDVAGNVHDATQVMLDLAFIVDQALNNGLTIESSQHQPHGNYGKDVIEVRGTFPTFMRFLGSIQVFGSAVSESTIRATGAGIHARLVFINGPITFDGAKTIINAIGRDPFTFYTERVNAAKIIGRGIMHDKHMVCEAYASADGTIKMRWVHEQIPAKKALQLRTS